MKNLLYILTVIISSSSYCNAQNAKQQYPTSNIQLTGLSDQQRLKELVSVHQGTYQVRVSKVNYAPIMNLTLLETVINSREQDVNVSIEIDEFTRVFIPSNATIESENFLPLETVVYLLGPTNVETNN